MYYFVNELIVCCDIFSIFYFKDRLNFRFLKSCALTGALVAVLFQTVIVDMGPVIVLQRLFK